MLAPFFMLLETRFRACNAISNFERLSLTHALRLTLSCITAKAYSDPALAFIHIYTI